MRAWNWILISLVVVGFISGCDTFGTSTGEHNKPCFGDGTCLEGFFCEPVSDTCLLPEEECVGRECGKSPTFELDCGTCAGEGEVCISGQCVVLTWQNPYTADPMKWQEAIDYCNNLTLNDHSDWHLPTISELRSLIRRCPDTELGGSCDVTDACLSADCWDSQCAGCPGGQGCYWPDEMQGYCVWHYSSSSHAGDSANAWCVAFYHGDVDNLRKDNNTEVRCVRRGP